MKNFLFCALALLSLTPLSAELYYNPYVSATAQSTSFAGAAASAQDISLQYFNPAVINYHYDKKWIFDSSLYWPRSRPNVEGTLAAGGAIPGKNYRESSSSFTPAFGLYGAHTFSDHFHLGLAITTPWLMNTQYNGDFNGRYYGLKSKIYSVNIAPTLAFSWLNFLSFALGPQFQQLHFDYRRAIDFGSIGLMEQVPNPVPGERDGYQQFRLSNWGTGLVVGLILQPCSYIRLGCGYRSSVTHDDCVKGDFDLGVYGSLVARTAGFFTPGLTKVEVKTPSQVWAGFHYDHNNCFDFSGGFESRNWDDKIVLGSDTISDKLGTVNALSFGGRYRHPSTAYVLRAGIKYGFAPSNSAANSPLFFADRNFQFSCGGEWCLPYGGIVSLAYTHNFMAHASIGLSGSGYVGPIHGNAKYDSDILSMQLVKEF